MVNIFSPTPSPLTGSRVAEAAPAALGAAVLGLAASAVASPAVL